MANSVEEVPEAALAVETSVSEGGNADADLGFAEVPLKSLGPVESAYSIGGNRRKGKKSKIYHLYL